MAPGSSAAVRLGISGRTFLPQRARGAQPCPWLHDGFRTRPLLGQMFWGISKPAGTLGTARADSRNIPVTRSRVDWEPQGGAQARHSQTPIPGTQGWSQGLSLIVSCSGSGHSRPRAVWPPSLIPRATPAPLPSGSALGSAGTARKAAVVLLIAGAGTGCGRKQIHFPEHWGWLRPRR